MKSLFVISVLSLLIFSCTPTSKRKNDLFYDGIKGKVSGVSMTFYDVTDSSGKYDKTRASYKFNFDFNPDGNITHQKGVSFQDTAARVIEETYFIYNNKGLRIAAQHSKASKPYTTESYDDNGKLKAIYSLDDQTEKTLKTTKLIYKAGDSLCEYNVYSSDGKLTDRTVYKSKGDLVTRLTEYDGAGQLIEQSDFGYDAEGRLVAKAYKTKGQSFKTSIKYADFDSSGNYLTAVSYTKGKPYQIEKRVLTYY